MARATSPHHAVYRGPYRLRAGGRAGNEFLPAPTRSCLLEQASAEGLLICGLAARARVPKKTSVPHGRAGPIRSGIHSRNCSRPIPSCAPGLFGVGRPPTLSRFMAVSNMPAGAGDRRAAGAFTLSVLPPSAEPVSPSPPPSTTRNLHRPSPQPRRFMHERFFVCASTPVLHGDNGATLKATTVLAMLHWFGI